MTLEMIPWVVARATGFTAFLALTMAMVAGLMVRTRTPVAGVKGAGMVQFHRLFSATALWAMAVHGTALLFDQTITVTPMALVVPGLIDHRPVWTALGVIAAELALAVHMSFRLRGRIGVGAWRRLHMLTYLAFALGAAHGIVAGTDANTTWGQAIYGGAVAAVAGLTGWRVATARRAHHTRTPHRGEQSLETAGTSGR